MCEGNMAIQCFNYLIKKAHSVAGGRGRGDRGRGRSTAFGVVTVGGQSKMAEPRKLHGEGRDRTSPEGWAGVRTMSPGTARVGRGFA